MSYQVLARKWRPRTFAQMVGQAHVLKALVNALKQGRLHHAYLFTGTRGVGKTTLARILAKCLNCEQGVTSEPCGQCNACREIDGGRFVDLIEVDAASRTKVEDTRELLDNVQYAPAYGRYKVYLIDEVHMLSGHSFNALLKTLEEPPPHVKFLLATTDPQKLPMTVLSRCLQFNLKRMPAPEIRLHLRQMLEREQVPADDGALIELARAADGSMRDALSLLDQAIGFGDGEVREAAVREMLGSVPREQLHKLALSIADADVAAGLRAIAELAEQGVDFAGVLAELVSLLHAIALEQAVPGAVDEESPHAALAAELAGTLSPQEVQLYYQIAVIGRRDLPFAVEARDGLEMVLLRMLSFRPLASQDAVANDAPAPVQARGAHTAGRPMRQAAPASPKGAVTEHRSGPGPVESRSLPEASDQEWPQLARALNLKGVASALASNCSLQSITDNEVRLVLEAGHAQIRTSNAEARLCQALSDHLGRPLRLHIEIAEHAAATPAQLAGHDRGQRQRAADAAIEADATVQAFKQHFAAEIVPGSVRPIKQD